MRRTVSQVLMHYLHEHGVRYIFGVSGHSVFDLTDALYIEPDLDFVPTQMEQGAAYAADAYARATRQVGVCLGSAGPGAANLVSGVAQAFKESSPVIALAADIDTGLMGKGASSWHEIPQEEMFRPITKLSVTLKAAEDVVEVVHEAYRQATTGRRGPVYVGIPRELQGEEIDFDAFRRLSEPPGVPAADPSLIQRAADLLAAATSPTIIAGGGAYWAHAEEEVRQLAELLGAPFGVPHPQKGLITEDHPLALGVLGFGSFPYANPACLESDVILAVGTTLSEGLTLGYEHRVIPEGARIIHIDLDPGEIGKTYPTEVGIVGDAKGVLRQLLAELRARGPRPNGSSPRLQRIADENRQWREELVRRGAPADGPITTTQIYHAVRSVLPTDAVVVGEGGTGELMSRFPASGRVFSSGDYRAIGHGIPTSVGVAHAFSGRRVVCVSGDGSFMMSLQELATVSRVGLPITFIVIHNDAYGSMKRDQIHTYDGRVIGTELHIPDLPTLAKSFGLLGERVERSADLAPAISRSLEAPRPTVLDVVCPIEGL